jgi:hypothetical protein
VLPDLLHADDNVAGAVRSANHFVFPPHIVLERGMVLKEWAKQERGYGEVGQQRARTFGAAHLL